MGLRPSIPARATHLPSSARRELPCASAGLAAAVVVGLVPVHRVEVDVGGALAAGVDELDPHAGTVDPDVTALIGRTGVVGPPDAGLVQLRLVLLHQLFGGLVVEVAD